MAIDFSKWNEQFGGTQAVEDLKKASENEYTELDDGTYVCKLDKLELGESKKGQPMVKGQFRIVEGEHKNQCLFYNQVFTRGFPQHKALEFLRSMEIFDKEEIDFTGDFAEFNDLLLDLAEAAEEDSVRFEITKSHDGEYTRLEIEDVFS